MSLSLTSGGRNEGCDLFIKLGARCENFAAGLFRCVILSMDFDRLYKEYSDYKYEEKKAFDRGRRNLWSDANHVSFRWRLGLRTPELSTGSQTI